MSRLRYGVIGTGMMGIEHIWNLRALDDVEVTAIADPHPSSLELAELAVGGAEAVTFERFADHRELLDSGLCDVVVVASPNMTHRAVLDDVLATPHHVLVEKPLCTTVADCRAVIDAAEASRASHPDRVVWVGLEYRYMPPVAELARRVHAGEVGRVRMVALREHRFPFLAKVGDWNRFAENTGGTLVEKCCHFFDLMVKLCDQRPTRVMASGAQDVNHLDERYHGRVPDIIDNALVVVDFDGGARASLDLCMFAEASQEQEEVSVVGDEGKVEAFLPSSTLRTGRRERGRPGVATEAVTDERVAYEGFHHGSSYLEHLDLAAVIRRGGQPEVGLSDGLTSVAMGVAAERSIAEGRMVDMAEVLE